MRTDTRQTAEEILRVVPRIMQALRQEMRSGRGEDLTVPQFRTLMFFRRRPGEALKAAAEHIGFTLPAMSRLVETLVSRGLLSREISTEDRRRVAIALTETGRRQADEVLQAARETLTRRLEGLEPEVLDRVAETLAVLRRAFLPGEEAVRDGQHSTTDR